MSIKYLIGMVLAIAVAACASSGSSDSYPIGANAPIDFTYRFSVPHESKDELRDAARLYFAFGDGDVSPPTLSSQDSDDGTLLGKGLTPWLLPVGILCYAHYRLKIVAEDEKLTLNLTLDFSDMEGPFSCSSWSKPTHGGYARIVAGFNSTADGLRTALQAGNGAKGRRGF